MDLKEIKKIIELMKTNDLSEFELEEQGFRIAIKRKNGQESQVVVSAGAGPPVVMVPSTATASGTVAGIPDPGATVDEANPAEPENIIPSPMVGTFYQSSAPDADSFVSVGQEIDEDTVVCIIEAMKVMNEIKAEMRGVIKKRLVENASTVEYGQPLFEVDLR